MLAPLLLLAACASARATALPPISYFPGVNAAFSLSEDGRGQGAGESGAWTKFIGGGFASISACAAAAASWRNASAPASRCLSATLFRAPRNASFLDQCFCLVTPKWFAVPSDETDSARLLWPCASRNDCSHNGACDAGTGLCVCEAAWGGPRCSELQLLPVDSAAPGLRFVSGGGANVSTWGAPMLQDAATGRWHAWASEMLNFCGINSWTTNSHIVHATAPGPGGPWQRAEEVVPAFAHEPNVVRGPAGEWVMAYSAYPLPDPTVRCTDCANGETLNQTSRTGCGPNASHPFATLLAVAPSPDGPWGAPIDITKLNAPWDWNLALTILPNRSAVGVLRAIYTWHATAFDDATTWQPVGGEPEGPGLPDGNVEDPFIWQSKGVFHVIFHSMDVADDPAFCGGHAFSEDGATWVYTGFAYGARALYSDGSWQSFSRRERPHLLFAPDGETPVALSNGVQYGARDAIFTLVQYIATPTAMLASL